MSGVIEVEKEFVAELVDSFFKSLSQCLSLALKGSVTPLESLKMVLSWAIENIRDLGKADQTTSLELMVEDLEKDVGSILSDIRRSYVLAF